MNDCGSLRAVAAVLVLAALGCRSKTASKSEQPAPASAGGFLHFEDSRFALDYPPDFKVEATASGGDEMMAIGPKAPPGGSTDGSGTIAPDPMHPDMLQDDEVASYAKTAVEKGSRILGGVRRLPTRNGACTGLVEIAPWEPCPDNVPFKPAGGKCWRPTLYAFCASPTGKRLLYGADLAPIPTPDQLSSEAANYGRIHERILSTLQFK